MEEAEKIKLHAELTAQFMVTQLEQIKLWRGDDVDVTKLERACAEIATAIIDTSTEMVTGFYGRVVKK